MSRMLLEVIRERHEEVDRLEQLIVKELGIEPATSRERLLQSHRIRNMIDKLTDITLKLAAIYGDKDGAMEDEIAALECEELPEKGIPNPYDDKLEEMIDYHCHHPAAATRIDEIEPPRVEFSGEEAFGRYLDLHELYNVYINSKFGEPIEYSAYLDDVFSKSPPHHKISRKLKLTGQYKQYLKKLMEYLLNFLGRTQPLQDVDRIFLKLITGFEEQWAANTIKGGNINALNHVQGGCLIIDLDDFDTVEELMMQVRPERIKEALVVQGLKTGGTDHQRAARLFLTKHTPLEQLDRKHFVTTLAKGGDESWKQIALAEAKMRKLCDLLQQTIFRTKEMVERKQALTNEEMEVEREEAYGSNEIIDDDDDEEEHYYYDYNPLKLPMGWDGKPIPYWLFKLHGLGQEFKCEICGNHSYWGRRDYERHFKEWRHQHGMRCLGIPNTNSFNEITSIEEAKQLWERVRERQRVKEWRPDQEEEYEDTQGNIYNKKTYTELQRQGLF